MNADYSPLQPQFGPERAGDVKHSFASIERLTKATGWKPKVSLSEGIEDLLRSHFKKNRSTLTYVVLIIFDMIPINFSRSWLPSRTRFG